MNAIMASSKIRKHIDFAIIGLQLLIYVIVDSFWFRLELWLTGLEAYMCPNHCLPALPA